VNLGMTRPEELELTEVFDFDGDGDDDLITAGEIDGGYDLTSRRAGPDGLGDVTTLTDVGLPVTGLTFRRIGAGRPVEALVTTSCDEPTCVERRLALSGRLLSVPDYQDAVTPLPRRMTGLAPA
jgi:hypothetical protein